MESIFLSYRRDDSADVTCRIYDRLVAAFGREAVFKDVDAIPLGVDFKKHIARVLGQCAVQLVVIGNRWLQAADPAQRRRLDDPSDALRIEIETGLGLGIPVIPLLVSGCAMPAEASLPPSLAELATRNALHVRPDPDFHHDLDRLIAVLRTLPLTGTDVEKADAFRRRKATSVLTIMSIDIPESMAMHHAMGDVPFEELRTEKRNTLTSIVENDGDGRVIKDLADGYVAIFALPEKAVAAALRVQKEVADDRYQLRIGLDMGQVIQESEGLIVKDVFGKQVGRARSIQALCQPGHVLTSYTVWDSAEGWFKHLTRIRWRRHGSYRLSAFSEPVEVFEPYDQESTSPSSGLAGSLGLAPDPARSPLRIFQSTPPIRTLRLKTDARLVTIGRSPESDVCCPEPTVSWEHGLILYTGGKYLYRHVSKTNPTRVCRDDDELLLSEGILTECVIFNGTSIVIGDVHLIVEIPTVKPNNSSRAPTAPMKKDRSA